jgi:hypothetical protein
MNGLVAAIDVGAIVGVSLVLIDTESVAGAVSCSIVIDSIMAETERPNEESYQIRLKSEGDVVVDNCCDGDTGSAIPESTADQEATQFPFKHLPVHNFPAAGQSEVPPEAVEDALDRNPDLWMYRDRTIALLRRYMRYSLEAGRLPSVLGSEFFRTRVTSYSSTTFEDRVIFVHDVKTCLGRIDSLSQQILARIILQEYSHEQVAILLGCTRKTIQRTLLGALDVLSEVLLGLGLLDGIPSRDKKSCQGGKNDDFPVSDCDEGKYSENVPLPPCDLIS